MYYIMLEPLFVCAMMIVVIRFWWKEVSSAFITHFWIQDQTSNYKSVKYPLFFPSNKQ